MRPRSTHVRRTAAICLAAAAALGLSSCGALNPRLPDPNYEASDGVALDLSGQVTGENLLIVSGGADEPGTLLGALTNRGGQLMSVTISLPGAAEPVVQSVSPGQTVLLGGEGKQVLFPAVPAAPGATQLVTFASPQLGSQEVPLPVLDGTLPEYATIVPTPTPSPTQAQA